MPSPTDFTERIRRSCALVADRATRVRINTKAIGEYAAGLDLNLIESPAHDPQAHFLDHGEQTVAFFLTLDAVNFGSGWFPHLKKRPGRSGYFSIATALTEYFQTHGPIPADQLVRLTAADCTRIFGQEPANEPIRQLMALFAQALNDLGNLLIQRFSGSFTALVEASDHSVEHLIAILLQMPFFNDTAAYGNLTVHFYKRAQILAADLAVAFEKKGFGYFRDLDHLTIFADNLVPHVLRIDGILRYDPDLAARIDAATPIASGSAEEIELRACAVCAVEQMAAALQRTGKTVNASDLDFLLWNRGQQPAYKQAKPRHRSRSVFY
jgi:hypothetical protein